jgi:WD40 repeat protein
VLTFGYNTHFSSKKEQASGTIGDFATDLLFRMKYGESTPERLGQVPIVFVAHSMGGLVFKKAFVQGHLNNEFSEIVSMVKAVLFLATPHRGTDLAETLNKLLSSSVFGHSPKEYVTELARRSPTIDELNEAFRHHASKLQLFSFYETLATAAGPVSLMVLDKPTAVMGYPNEMPTPLNANHHDVCKFTSKRDPNYTSVIGALRSVADSVLSPIGDAVSKDDLRHLSDLLGVTGPPEEDLNFSRSVRKQGTCESFLASDGLSSWLRSDSQRVLWAHAQPGGGKSTICSFVIEYLLDAGHHCSYFFFKYGQRKKQSTSNMLQSLAYQTALQLPAFRRALVELARSGTRLSKADSLTIWGKLFSSHFAAIRADNSIYWVLDGIDEAESSKRVIELISRVADFESPVRVLVLSRPLANINKAFQLARRKINVTDMPLPDNRKDIQLMVAEEIDYLLSDDAFKTQTVDEIAARAQGNFLWASLVTKRVVKCHREDQVKRVLDSTPDGMHDLYDRMTDAVLELELSEDKALAKMLLTWAMFARTPITVEELLEVYPSELSSIMDLNHTINQVCGQFVVINPQGRVTLVHHSAREYLKKTKRLPFSLDSERANEELLDKCLTTLCDKGLRRKLQMLKVPKFLPYAATSWASHLDDSSPDSNQVLDSLIKFFNGPYPLAWIQYLAMSGRVSDLFGASRRLTTFVRKQKKADANNSPMLHRLTHLSLLETWAIDLMKLPAKFGRHLSDRPSLIYECIPALSPASSIIHQKFEENPAARLSVFGLSNQEWDDCLARVSGGSGRALRVVASPLFLAVASDEPRGTVTVWDTKLFGERKAFALGEHVWALAFNNSGSLLACYSLSKTFVWKVTDWEQQISAENPRQERGIEFKFDENDALMMISEHRRVYRLQTRQTDASPRWEQQDPRLLDEPGVPEGTFLSTPSCVAFNGDCTQIAVAYRSFPLSIWTVDPPEMIARLRRKHKPGQGAVDSYTGDNKVVWHPSGTEVVGIYGQIFKWSPDDDTYNEVKDETGVVPHGLACSPDGQVFITMDVGGSIKIYELSSMSLLYKLSSEDRINQIFFAPDSLRFYDLRGSYCNIWEPNCLLRLADAALEQISDTENTADSFWSDTADTLSTSISFPASESHAESKPAIVAVEPGRASHRLLIAHTNDDGTINIYDTASKRKHEIGKTMFKMMVEQLAWSPKQDRLAYSPTNGATIVKSVLVDCKGERTLSTKTVYSEKRSPADRGRTRQLLFHGAGDRLLIYGVKKCLVLSLPEGAELAECQLTGSNDPVKWQQHPLDPESLLCFSAQSVTIFSWGHLEEKASIPLDLAGHTSMAGDKHPTLILDAILDSYSPRLLLLRTVTMRQNRPRFDFVVLPTQHLYARTTVTQFPPSSAPSQSDSDIKTRTVKPLLLSQSLTAIITHALGILPDARLVFLDRQLWVCTTSLSHLLSGSAPTGTEPDVRRHFFLPHDWVTTEGLRLCRILRDGTLLCPCKGQIAVLKGDLIEDC